MRFVITTVLVSILFVTAVSCRSAGDQFAAGKVYPKVVCEADTSVDYALCLPENYHAGDSFILLILFDSHGDGLLPVNLFRFAASEQGIIIAGSNNSKNGLPAETTTGFYRSMRADLLQKFSINTRAVYTCGFSGGSRVAASAAITEGDIAGVIGCGAGWPNSGERPKSAFSYLGIAGTRDFNLTEMQQLDASLQKAGFIHHLTTFGGKHQWPPADVVPDIITWVSFDAMRQNAIPTDRKAINNFIELNSKLADSAATSNNQVLQQDIYLKMADYLQGLNDITPLKNEIARLAALPAVIAFRQKQQKQILLETHLQQNYIPQLSTQTIDWWRAETAKLHKLASENNHNAEAAIYDRVLGALSLNCYMLATNAVKQHENDNAFRYVELYGLIDPENCEHFYLSAQLAAREQKSEAVFDNLKQAVKLGFNDQKRVLTDPDLLPYAADPQFRNIFSSK